MYDSNCITQAKKQYHQELAMLIKEAQFERSELIVEMARVHEVFVQLKVRLAAFLRYAREIADYIKSLSEDKTQAGICPAQKHMLLNVAVTAGRGRGQGNEEEGAAGGV